MTASTNSPRMTRWLIVGLITGLAIAMMGLIREQAPAPLSEDLIARAAGQDITRTDYEAALRAVAADKRGPLTAADQRRVREQLVNEALLVAHGRDLGLVERVPRLRDTLVDEVLASLRAEAESQPVDEATLRAYYADNRARFAGPDLLQLDALRFPDEASARAASEALSEGSDMATVARREGGTRLPLPDGPLPAAKLRDYVGASAAEAATRLETGKPKQIVTEAGTHLLLRLEARQPAPEPAFADIADSLRQAIVRDRAEALMAERLAALRERYPVQRSDDPD